MLARVGDTHAPCSGRAIVRAVTALALAVPGHEAHAHAVTNADAPTWGEPWLALVLVAAAGAYARGWWVLRRRTGHDVPRLEREARFFAAGWLVLAGATLSPLHAAGARSFTLHMLEHELLMLVAAPLLALSRPLATTLWALPTSARRVVGRAVRSRATRGTWRIASDPWIATLLQAAALWIWHVPALFELALVDEGWHYLQHATFLVTALVFWWSIAGGRAGRRGYAVGAACLFVTSLVGGALGALMALSTSPWYEAYAELGLAPFGLTPVEDQQLAGLLMWIPGGLVHAGAALWMLVSWLRRGAERPNARELSRVV
jgi:putative membrane protein